VYCDSAGNRTKCYDCGASIPPKPGEDTCPTCDWDSWKEVMDNGQDSDGNELESFVPDDTDAAW